MHYVALIPHPYMDDSRKVALYEHPGFIHTNGTDSLRPLVIVYSSP